MNPLACLVLIVVCLVVSFGNKRQALLGMAAGVLYLSQSAGLEVLGLNLFSFRLLEVVLFARVAMRRELNLSDLNAIDRTFLLLFAFTSVVVILRSSTGVVFQLGAMIDAYAVYFSCRALIDTPEDFRWFLRSFVLLLIPFVVIVVLENLSGGRALAFTGWAPPGGFTYMTRHDRIRCMGSFRHPSLLGTIAVSNIPMLIGLAYRRIDRNRAVLGIVLCLAIVWAANSGGPISGVAFGCFAWCFWRFRTRMLFVRWGIVGLLVMAGILMKAPIWYLADRVSGVSGGDGWHRSYLMNMAFQSLGKWWFAGMPMSETAEWFPYTVTGAEAADITNQFLIYGLAAGLGAMAIFGLLLTRAFSALGKALQAVRAASPEPGEAEFFLWGLGCMLGAHIINWFGISYFDQTWAFWYLQLVAISRVSDWYLKMPSEAVVEAQDEESGFDLGHQIETTAQ